eukprot:GFKZ01012950.1.p1 GENE.GFKZ01012950.1~~GFKZ01012950.1.p1  ORF type:complete len:256 (+),score=31.68 GFKZ01012950.1:144-911(+)
MSLKITADHTRGDRDPSVTASAAAGVEPIRHTQRPIVTGSSILGIRCADGVVLASDTLASYGSLARFRQISRMHKASSHTLIAAGGDVSDFQEVCNMVDAALTTDYCHDDGHELSARALYQYLARVMYNRRNKMDPLWNYVVVGGWQDGGGVLGLVDLVGMHFESEVIATGYGEYIGLPLLRKAWKEDMTVEEGKKVLEQVLTVLFYRDARTIDRVEIATITEKGVQVEPAKKLQTEWSYKQFVQGARSGDVSTW